MAGCNSASREPAPGHGLPLSRCQLESPTGIGRVEAECATVEVPEDWSRPEGKRIPIHVAVLRGVSRTTEPDPLFFFAGGPGQAASEAFVDVTPGFDGIHRRRDIVLIDQRGTGKSSQLRCEGLGAGDEETWVLSGKAVGRQLAECADEIQIDTTLYTTSAAVRDFDFIREKLGYERINLYGISYGTRVALTYMKHFGPRVRSVILDGVLPQDHALGSQVAEHGQRALDKILARCQADRACRGRFPDLESDFRGLLETLRAAPRAVDVPHPTSGMRAKKDYTLEDFVQTVRFLSYSTETASLLPLLIDRAAETSDFRPWFAQTIIVATLLERSLAAGLNLSVLCAEDQPFWPASKALGGNYLGTFETDNINQYCAAWPHGTVEQEFKEPVTSEIPVLLLSGEADPVTPPSNAAHVAKTLSRSVTVVAPGQGHGVIHRGCIPKLAEKFVEKGDGDGLDTSCVAKIHALPFFMDMTGPEP